MNKNLPAVEERIRELVPRLKSKNPGLIIKHNGEVFTYLCSYSSAGVAVCYDTLSEVRELPMSECEIIGHTINLESVLEAIDTKYSSLAMQNNTWALWQYGKPLPEQSDELIDFLASILL